MTVLYYILLATPIILLIVWVAILAHWHESNPAVIIFFIGVFIILLFLPSQSKFFYFKILGLFISFLLTQFLLVSLNWIDKYVSFLLRNPMTFYAWTALMLTFNAIFVAICLWIVDGSLWNISTNTHQDLKERIIETVKIWKKA